MPKLYLHRIRLIVAAAAIAAILISTLAYGLDYYRLAVGERVYNEKHQKLRPSGSIGVKLGMLAALLFCGLYAYPVRKRWKWLQRFGKTKNWLDFHVLFGVTAPLITTVHSSFKLQGLAGIAYWLMIAVMWSGFIGRYFYAQIPRSLNTAALSLDEIRELCSSTRKAIERQITISPAEIESLLRMPDSERIEQMSLAGSLIAMVWLDIQRPFRMAALRRRLRRSFAQDKRFMGGLLPSSNAQLEEAIRLVRRQSWLLAKLAFLGRANQVFQLWHVVHRPFSYSFAVLALIHITFVLLLGYY